ncbi:MAG: 50S ribosomal protein L4 [Spirochaetota bacterium]|nr:MAG: 50S ribosomal protein L4 [Spirochaetota bacterium]
MSSSKEIPDTGKSETGISKAGKSETGTAMNVAIYDTKGNKKGTVTLNEKVFNIVPNKSAIYYTLKAELANQRQGTSSSKGRAEVRGSGAKLYRQKGTGRARAGSRRSPIRVGGGVAFGPKAKSYRIRIAKKVRRLSVRSLLSLKVKENLLKVVEDFDLKDGKTREFLPIAKNLVDDDKRRYVLLVDDKKKELVSRAGRNIPWIKYYAAELLTTRDLFYATQLVLTTGAVKLLNERYG